jgi:class 3 adenylate cyclase/FixJ family two-component response regulator
VARILIVDDEPRVLDSLEALLAAEYEVLRAEEPKAALAVLAETEVAVIVSDQRMPGMSGVELLAESRRVAPDTVRILLTAFTDADALMTSINAAGVYHFLLKPWDPGELLHLVRRAVERYELTRERERLLRDLSTRNAALETALAELRTTQTGLVREAALRAQLERYVSPRLVEAAVANPELLDLPGDWREATVLFADIRGFTRLIERTPPAVVIRLLDEYFEAMVGIVFRHEGTVEQLIVALFGVHEGEAGAPDRAVRAALEMTTAVAALAERWRGAGLPTFDIGVGLSTGRLMAGTIGSRRRRELIVLGRPMIAAARIQRMTRLFGVRIIACEDTFRQVSDHVRSRELGRPKLKGLAHRSTLHEILGREPEPAREAR